MKLVLGPTFLQNEKLLEERKQQFREGHLDNYHCFVYIPPDKKYEQETSYLKIKDIRKYMYEVYTDELFRTIDMDEYIKNEIEQKGIVVIDEIDKLVRQVRTYMNSIRLWIE